MHDYDFRVVDEFIHRYDALTDEAAAVVDAAIMRLLENHKSAWARQGRVDGELGEAWIIEVQSQDLDIRLYWNYLDDGHIVLLALILRRV